MFKLPVKIIALDLDDTLLKNDLTISDYTVEILQKASQLGIYIVICSGRTDNAIFPYVKRLNIEESKQGRFLIAQNGTSIYDLHLKKTIYEKFLSSDILIRIHQLATAHGLFTEVYDASTIYIPEDNEWTDVDAKLTGLKKKVVKDYIPFLSTGFPKIVIPGKPEVITTFAKELKSIIGNECVIFSSKPFFLEVIPLGCGKGEALEWLTNYLGLHREDTMAFGDSMNDESMMRYAFNSIAMINGLEYIQKISTYITKKTNNYDGVADFIEKYVL